MHGFFISHMGAYFSLKTKYEFKKHCAPSNVNSQNYLSAESIGKNYLNDIFISL